MDLEGRTPRFDKRFELKHSTFSILLAPTISFRTRSVLCINVYNIKMKYQNTTKSFDINKQVLLSFRLHDEVHRSELDPLPALSHLRMPPRHLLVREAEIVVTRSPNRGPLGTHLPHLALEAARQNL